MLKCNISNDFRTVQLLTEWGVLLTATHRNGDSTHNYSQFVPSVSPSAGLFYPTVWVAGPLSGSVSDQPGPLATLNLLCDEVTVV